MIKKRLLVAVLISAIILIGFCSMVVAENLEDLQNKKEELQNQINESNEQIQEIQVELTENLEQLNKLNENIYKYESEISNLENSLNNLQKDIDKVAKKLNIVEENYNLQKTALETRIVAIYEAGDIAYLDVLLNSNSFSDFVSNYFLIGEVARYDNELLENIEKQKIEIENAKKTLEEKQKNIQTIKKGKEKTTIALENSKVIKNSYIDKLNEDELEIQNRIDEYQTELNNIESQIVAIAMDSISEEYIGGEFAWPAPGYTTITSRFGMRIHPILKVARVHTGTDIGMPTGASIIAANDGVVIKSMYTTGYGNMVMIDHGGGVVTLYGHGSEIIAKTGDTVKKGDIIMKAGSTGWSTGPHLHFEVRINGTAVDSLPYITKQKTNETNAQENGGEE